MHFRLVDGYVSPKLRGSVIFGRDAKFGKEGIECFHYLRMGKLACSCGKYEFTEKMLCFAAASLSGFGIGI